jgi:hypothetical protein
MRWRPRGQNRIRRTSRGVCKIFFSLSLAPRQNDDLGGCRQFRLGNFQYWAVQRFHSRHAVNVVLYGLLPPKMHGDGDLWIHLLNRVLSSRGLGEPGADGVIYQNSNNGYVHRMETT